MHLERRGEAALSGSRNEREPGGPEAPRRVLLAQTSFLGDVVLTTALARTIEAAWPQCEISWMVRPDAVPLLSPTHGADRVLSFDKRGTEKGWRGVRSAARRLESRGFDVAIGVQRSLRTAAVLAAARIPLRVGYAGSAGAWLYHRRVEKAGAHARDRLVALAEGLGISAPRDPAGPRLDVAREAAGRVQQKLGSVGIAPRERLLVVAPGSAWATKQWPAPRFGEAARALLEHGVDRVIVIGRGQDRPWAEAIRDVVAQGTREGQAVVDVTGEGGIDDAVAWIARARLVLANDSAPAHIAAALGRPVVALFGPTVPAQGFAPLGETVRIVERSLECRPCSRHGGATCPLGTHECLADLPATDVVRTGLDLLETAEATEAGS